MPLPTSLDDSKPIGPSLALIKVKSAAINPVDYKIPKFIGGAGVSMDVSGVVERVGADVTDFKVGDEVFGRANVGSGATGALADYALVDKEEVAKKPEWMSFDEGAAIGVVYLTGIECLRKGDMEEGSTVMIIGASGGCGIAGIQLANAMGASRIVGICSGKNFEFVREMSGIKDEKKLELVDYTDDDMLSKFRENNAGQFDCIYDTATGSGHGEDYPGTMIKLLKEKTGQYVMINGRAKHLWMAKMNSQVNFVLTSRKSKDALEQIATLLESTGVKPHVNVISFDEKGVADGFEQLKGRRTKGKIVFKMD